MFLLYPLLRKLPVRHRLIVGGLLAATGAVVLLVGLIAVTGIVVDGVIVLAVGAVLVASAWRTRRVEEAARGETERGSAVAG